MRELKQELSEMSPQETLGVMQVVNQLRASIKVPVVNLTAGEPTIAIPRTILKKLKSGGRFTTYADAKGLPGLREQVAAYVSGYTGINFLSGDIFVGPGGRTANDVLMAAHKNLAVSALEPFWPGYLEALLVTEALTEESAHEKYRLIERDSDFKVSAGSLDEQLIRIEIEAGQSGARQIMMIECEPGNPLTLVSSKQEIMERAEVYSRHPGVLVHCDDVYREIVHDPSVEVHSIEKAYVAAGGDERNITVLFSASKVIGVPGWRIAAIATKDKDLLKAMQAIAGRKGYNASTPAQHAVAEALRNGWYKATAQAVSELSRSNLDALRQGLESVELEGKKVFTVLPSGAGIYAVVQGNKGVIEGAVFDVNNEKRTIQTTRDFHEWMILNGVAAVNASTMSPPGKRDYLFRMCVAGVPDSINMAAEHLNSPTYALRK